MDREEINRIFTETDRRIDEAFEKFGKEMARLIRESWEEVMQKSRQ